MVRMLVFSFIIYPVVSYLSNPKRRWNRYRKSTGREIAVVLLFVIAFVNSMKLEKNYFQRLSASPHSSVDFIKKSFKHEAFRVHPDRNTSPTASEDYVDLVRIYKTLVNDKSREAYCRYADLISDGDKRNDLTPAEVLYMVFLNSFVSLVGMFFVILLYGHRMVNISALIYELFCLALEVYLRFTPDARSFMSFVPILRYYTIFELITFCRSFRIFFMYYSNISEKEQDDTSMRVGAAILKNNVLAIDTLDRFMTQTRGMYSSMPHPLNGESAIGSSQGEAPASDGQINSNETSWHFTRTPTTELITTFPDRPSQRRSTWNRSSLQRLLRQADTAMGASSSTSTWVLHLLSLLVSSVI